MNPVGPTAPVSRPRTVQRDKRGREPEIPDGIPDENQDKRKPSGAETTEHDDDNHKLDEYA